MTLSDRESGLLLLAAGAFGLLSFVPYVASLELSWSDPYLGLHLWADAQRAEAWLFTAVLLLWRGEDEGCAWCRSSRVLALVLVLVIALAYWWPGVAAVAPMLTLAWHLHFAARLGVRGARWTAGLMAAVELSAFLPPGVGGWWGFVALGSLEGAALALAGALLRGHAALRPVRTVLG